MSVQTLQNNLFILSRAPLFYDLFGRLFEWFFVLIPLLFHFCCSLWCSVVDTKFYYFKNGYSLVWFDNKIDNIRHTNANFRKTWQNSVFMADGNIQCCWISTFTDMKIHRVLWMHPNWKFFVNFDEKTIRLRLFTEQATTFFFVHRCEITNKNLNEVY